MPAAGTANYLEVIRINLAEDYQCNLLSVASGVSNELIFKVTKL